MADGEMDHALARLDENDGLRVLFAPAYSKHLSQWTGIIELEVGGILLDEIDAVLLSLLLLDYVNLYPAVLKGAAGIATNELKELSRTTLQAATMHRR
jgi:hypothetical protein